MGSHARVGFVLLLPAAVTAQNAIITGRVQGQALTPVSGATVAIPSLGLSTVTSDLGVYRLSLPVAGLGAQPVLLRVAVIGYASQEVQLALNGGEIRRDFTLKEHAIALDAIVVTGTAGQLERRAQSAVVATIDAARIAEEAPISTVGDLVQARVPGVSLQRASGTSGTAQLIRIRGAASISLSNEPLVFIDGVLSDSRISQFYFVGGQAGSRLNDIPPEDIESIEIVKGPAAATLYGADASAGVIQIITKRGRTGSRFSQNLSLEITSLDQHWTPPDSWGTCTAADIARERDQNGELLTTELNPCLGQAVGTVVSNNPLLRADLLHRGEAVALGWSGRGGGDSYNYYLSLTADRESGTLPNNDWVRRGGQCSIGFTPLPTLRLEGSLGLNLSRLSLPYDDNHISALLGPLLERPVVPPSATADWWAGRLAIDNTNSTIRVRPRLAATFAPVPWLANTLTVGADLTRTEARNLFPRNDASWYGTADQNSGQISEARQHFDRITLEYRGNVTQRLSDALRLNYTLGVQYLSERNDYTSATGTGLITNSARSVSAATRRVGLQNYSEEKSLGGIGQVQLSLFERLYLKAAGRIDRHSSFGTDAGAFFSPNLGVSYVLSDEPALRSVLPSAISTLRVRSTWGTTGRSPDSGALRTYSAAAYLVAPATVAPGVVPNNPGNPGLKPERGVEIEAGLDVGLLNERVGLELTYFNKTSRDIVLARALPPSLGFADNPLINIGKVVNRGFEVAAKAVVLDGERVGLDLRAAVNTLHNEVLDLGAVAPFGNNISRVQEGLQTYAFVTRRIKRYDLAANRAIVGDSLEFVGNLLPTFEGNTAGTLSLFRVLRLYAQVDWRQDFYIFNLTEQSRERGGITRRAVLRDSILTQQERLRRFGPYFTEAGASVSAGLANEAYVQPGDYVRLREVSATLLLPVALARRLFAQSASITLAARNLGIWTAYPGADPEVNMGTNAISRWEFMTLPQPRRYVARVNLQF